MVDELIREITAPEEAGSAPGKAAARGRLIRATQSERPLRHKQRLGRRGLATFLALLVVPTGVAVATELSRDREQALVTVADCPEVAAAAEERGLSTEGLLVAGCPVGPEVDQALSLLAKLDRQREELGEGEAAIGVLGASPDEKSWSLWGVTGTSEGEQP